MGQDYFDGIKRLCYESHCRDTLLSSTPHVHKYHSDMAQDYFDGIKRSGLYKGFIFPVLATNKWVIFGNARLAFLFEE